MNFPFKLIDLTHIIDKNIPTWEGSCGFSYHIDSDYQESNAEVKFRVMSFNMKAGLGTHMDAPKHCIEASLAIHDLSLYDLCMPCCVIDVSDKCDENYIVSPEDIYNFENKFGKIPEKSCVMINTSWDKFWDTPNKYRNNLAFPSVSIEAATLLLDRNVKAIGIDTLSPDRPEAEYKVHKLFLGMEKVIFGNVANLQMMPKTGGYILALPLKIKDATESPMRLIGLIK